MEKKEGGGVQKDKEDEEGEDEEEVTGQRQEDMCHSCRVHAR